MGLNPISTSNFIYDRFANYAKTTLSINDESVNTQLRNLLGEGDRFSKGPIIEATPSYATGSNILELVKEGILSNSFNNLDSPSLPLDRKLYKHQEIAIRKICHHNRNVIVATGTGSGKTESFMIPVLNYLLGLGDKNKLTPGIRALLLYPMNALANDQMKRLRELLKNQPKITFGIYTGETEEKYSDAYEKFRRMHDVEPLENELISREQMKDTPPHILLTNYAMLEYLMLRPDDNVFFQGEFAKDWRFIVMDEAHTYTGSNGIEMSMLLSRLKNTIGIEKGKIRCILTSASLGSGIKDYPDIANFAEKLFMEEFTENDVIEAEKENLEKGEIWGSPSYNLYGQVLKKIEGDDFSNLGDILIKGDVPQTIVNKAIRENNGNYKGTLYDIFLGDKRVNNTISILSQGPMDFRDLCQKIFPNEKNGQHYMTALIDICNLVRKSDNSSSLIPARYHYFIRALEGAFLVFADKPNIYLERMNKVKINEKEYKAFEIGTCRKCNSLYLVGEVMEDEDTGFFYLKEYDKKYFEESNQLEYFAILEDDNYASTVNEDELDYSMKNVESVFSIFKLCTSCGAIREDIGVKTCDCVNISHMRLLRVEGKDNLVKKCGICGGTNPRGSIVRRFFLAEDTVSSVLATALYSKIPNRQKNRENDNIKDSIFGFIKEEEKANKQLLIFSDNRQNAAFFASYLNSSYKDMLTKSILTKVITDSSEACIQNTWSLEDYHNRVEKFLRENNIITGTIESIRREIWKWIMGEFISNSPNSLFNLGYLNFAPNLEVLKNSENLFNIPFLTRNGFSRDDLFNLYKYIFNQFRIHKAIEYPALVDPTDPYFSPTNTQGAFCRNITKPGKKRKRGHDIKSWKPSRESYSNSRLDYLSKIYEAKGIKKDKKELINDLDNLYELFVESVSPLHPYVKANYLDDYGIVIKLDPSIYKVVPGILDKDTTYYKCNKCYKITTININNVCPSYRCQGVLYEINMEDELKDNHYKKLFTSFEFEKMDVSEHTAQLKTEYAAEVQNKFINGDINVLSCSTTFELGVDVGELETVFMKNMPPTPANYAQRAGRAGRRQDSTAYALTYARLASHDFSNFSDPHKMISGTVKPPYFEVNNEKIARRHMYACALSAFWKKYSQYFRTVNDFFFNNEVPGPILLKKFLDRKPRELYVLIKNSIPENLHDILKINSWGWVDELYSKEGVMTKIDTELNHDLEKLENAKHEAASTNKFNLAKELHYTINTIKRRPLINYFSQKNLLPKYGFPVDVVNLEANLHIQEARNIELSRDLQIAISEYAPESQIVANGKLWTSRYVKKIRERDLVRNKFYSCKCGFFKTDIFVSKEDIDKCPVCGNGRITTNNYMMPEFGFITEASVKEPGNTRPEKTYSSRKHFSGNGNIIEEKEFIIADKIIKINAQNHGLLTVINNGKGGGFQICRICGYGTVNAKPGVHKGPEGNVCKGIFETVALGYDFETDIVEIELQDIFDDTLIEDGFWESLMYAIIEGMSSVLEIDRNDIDGTLHVRNLHTKSIILFDTVPGGAGHVKRLLDQEQLIKVLHNALERISNCSCGGKNQDTSCYNCLRNYYNQYCHDKLKRQYAIEGLQLILGKQLAIAY